MEKPKWGVTVYILSVNTWLWRQCPVADLRSHILDVRPPPSGPHSFMQFLGNFGKIVCWRPLGDILDPPLVTYTITLDYISKLLIWIWIWMCCIPWEYVASSSVFLKRNRTKFWKT